METGIPQPLPMTDIGRGFLPEVARSAAIRTMDILRARLNNVRAAEESMFERRAQEVHVMMRNVIQQRSAVSRLRNLVHSLAEKDMALKRQLVRARKERLMPGPRGPLGAMGMEGRIGRRGVSAVGPQGLQGKMGAPGLQVSSIPVLVHF